ncbi:MAG: DUF4352 domain-containing protein [Roseburia sp.]|nr:DUF4352 domain-containing protein [Roseburia sp.]
MGVAALVLSIIGCTFFIGAILAIIDLCKKDGKKKTCSIAALIICGLWLVIGIYVSGSNNSSNSPQRVNSATENNSGAENFSQSETKESEIKENNENTEETESLFRVGETAELNGVQVTLTDYIESNGGQYNKPTDGNVYVLAEFEIVNNSEKELTISSMLSFDAYADDYALNYSLSALLEKDGNQLDGTIAAGKKFKGWIGWEVAKDYQNIEIHFTDNVWSNNKFMFLIEK